MGNAEYMGPFPVDEQNGFREVRGSWSRGRDCRRRQQGQDCRHSRCYRPEPSPYRGTRYPQGCCQAFHPPPHKAEGQVQPLSQVLHRQEGMGRWRGYQEVRGFRLGPAHQEGHCSRQPDRLREVQGEQAEGPEAAFGCPTGQQEEVKSHKSHLFPSFTSPDTTVTENTSYPLQL